jgi:DNA-binding NtrC family response regulator
VRANLGARRGGIRVPGPKGPWRGCEEDMKILIIDDDATVRRSLEVALKNNGYEVDVAENGKEAIEKSNVNFYNLALIDIRLPDMEGTRLLTTMRDTVPRMVKIIVTGYPSLQNAMDALNRGADAYILKPFDLTKVLQTINQQLKKQEEEVKYSQNKIAEFIETRVKELEEETVNNKKPHRNT